MDYKIVDINKYYRKDVYLRFSDGPKCSISMTYKLDITHLKEVCKERNEKLNIALLYLVTKAINSRDDYKMYYDFKKNELRSYNVFNVKHYVFNKETEVCKIVHSKYYLDYKEFYLNTYKDIEEAKKVDFKEDDKEYPDEFDASAMPWVSYDSFNLELPDGYLYFNPIINWDKFFESSGRTLLPMTIRLNHAIADGYLLSKFFLIIEDYIKEF
jgi:chloramphenicol O-acetyltransferase type A